MDDDNAYKRRIAGLYDRAARSYGQVGPPLFRHTGCRLVEIAGVGPGDRVLDVATGRGAALFAAAERVGPAGYALGIDLSEAMVRETTAEIVRAGLPNVEARVMDAAQIDLPDGAFDVALCSFAVFFFPHPVRTLTRLGRVLRPGGSMGLAMADDMDPRWAWQNELMMRYAAVEPPPASVRGRELRRPGAIAELLAEAGFVQTREVREDAAFTFRDADEWWRSLWTHGTRAVVEAMSPGALASFRSEAFARLEQMAHDGGLTQRFRLIFALGYTVQAPVGRGPG